MARFCTLFMVLKPLHMNNTENTNGALESWSEGSYLMGTFAIVMMILTLIGSGFYLVVSNYA